MWRTRLVEDDGHGGESNGQDEHDVTAFSDREIEKAMFKAGFAFRWLFDEPVQEKLVDDPEGFDQVGDGEHLPDSVHQVDKAHWNMKKSHLSFA